MRCIAVIGHMNVGKTSLFKRICRGVSDHPYEQDCRGITKGLINGTPYTLLDAPGTDAMIFTPHEEERISRNLLLAIEGEPCEGAILVADAKRLKRSISLALQCIEYDMPMFLAVNMIDELDSWGIEIDYALLGERLDMDVLPLVARNGRGFSSIKNKLAELRRPRSKLKYPEVIENYLNESSELLDNEDQKATRGVLLLLLLSDRDAVAHVKSKYGLEMADKILTLGYECRDKIKDSQFPIEIVLANFYNREADRILEDVQVVRKVPKTIWTEKLSDACLSPWTGLLIAVFIIYLMYQFIGTFGATFLVDEVADPFFNGIITPFLDELLQPLALPIIRELLLDEAFGLLPTGLFLALGLVAPILFCFYLFFGFLEDSGYLPRFTLLLDKIFKKMGLNGKGALPIVMGFSCITMAILTTRMLDSKRERVIATFLLMLGIPCAPLLAVMFVVLGPMPLAATFLVFGIIFTQIYITGYLLHRVMPGRNTPLMLELPSMRMPSIRRLLLASISRTYFFIKEAIPLFMAAALMVFVFQRFGGLRALGEILRPLTVSFMGLPEQSVEVFIRAIVRRESGIAELQRISTGYNNLQVVVNILVMTFLAPCINAFIVIIKELGLKLAVLMLFCTIVYSIIVGGAVNHICLILGITF